MNHRSPIAVLLLSIITFGIYQIVWFVKTKNEMNRQGAGIPTAWLIIVPFVSIWWIWKYAVGAEMVTNNRLSSAVGFLLLFLLGSIGAAIVQNAFNNAPVRALQTV